MALKRTVYVARTAHDLQHVNRLHVPRYGVTKLYLSAGSKNTKSYLIAEAPAQKQASNATDDFNFAPEKEKLKIKYEIDDVSGCIEKATLELLYRNNKTAIWTKELKDGDVAHGPHEIEWDGKIPKGTDFPEEYITVEHSPYKLKLTIQGDTTGATNYSPAAWSYFHVLVHSIELEKGLKTILSRQLDKDLLDTVSLPAAKATQKIKLISNLFSVGGDTMDGTSFTQYRDHWKDSGEEGPNIPVFAKLFVKNSAGGKEDVPKVIGRVKLLWDWQDTKEDVSMHFTQAKEWLVDALNYDVAATRPKGDNCHKDRGGKRGDDSKPVFPARTPPAVDAAAVTAGKFPFTVTRCTTRKWSSYSETWRTGQLMGKTGVSFQPSHIAGDAYEIDVYFPHLRKPDGTDELDTADDTKLAHAIKVSTGIWQVWREVHITLYHKKHSSLPSLSFPTVATTLAKAYIELVDKSGAIQAPMAGYDGHIRGFLTGGGTSAEKQLAVKAGDQGTITKGGIMYVSYANFKAAVKTAKGFTAAALTTWLTANNMATNAGYEVVLEAIADNVVVKTCDKYFTASDGIKVFHLEPYWETEDGSRSSTGGFASTDFPTIKAAAAAVPVNHKRAGYIHGVLTPPPSIKEIASHEIGHTLFLPHAPGRAGGPAAHHDLVAHWKNCMMSYEFDKEMKFCGLCLCRLRGWDYRVLNSNRSLNKK
jgi:hypothetical protein